MRLRQLDEKDAELMVEWMHDAEIVGSMNNHFEDYSLMDCMSFIHRKDNSSLHLAIVDDSDEYMGTVSLKNQYQGTAEFAIIVRKVAMGRGFAKYGMEQILKFGFREWMLKEIYWYVKPQNIRALRFYDRNGFQRVNPREFNFQTWSGYCADSASEYIWYAVRAEDYR